MIIIGSRALHARSVHRYAKGVPTDTCQATCVHMDSDVDIICLESEVDTISKTAKLIDKRKIKTAGGTNKLIARSTTDRTVSSMGPSWSTDKDYMYELEIASPGTHSKALHDLIVSDPDTLKLDACHHHGVTVYIPSNDVSYMIKMSHRFLRNSPHFVKTINDIEFMRLEGAKITPRYYGVYLLRQKAQYSYKHPNLKMSKKDFFSGDGVKYVYDHDDIHKVMALYDAPAYTYFKKDGAEVAVDRSKFDKLPAHLKIASVIEESLVLAIERSQVPFKDKEPSPKASYLKALEKVCTSITSGWWREYAWEHYREAEGYIIHNPDYVTKFWTAVKDGKVGPHK